MKNSISFFFIFFTANSRRENEISNIRFRFNKKFTTNRKNITVHKRSKYNKIIHFDAAPALSIKMRLSD